MLRDRDCIGPSLSYGIFCGRIYNNAAHDIVGHGAPCQDIRFFFFPCTECTGRFFIVGEVIFCAVNAHQPIAVPQRGVLPVKSIDKRVGQVYESGIAEFLSGLAKGHGADIMDRDAPVVQFFKELVQFGTEANTSVPKGGKAKLQQRGGVPFADKELVGQAVGFFKTVGTQAFPDRGDNMGQAFQQIIVRILVFF